MRRIKGAKGKRGRGAGIQKVADPFWDGFIRI